MENGETILRICNLEAEAGDLKQRLHKLSTDYQCLHDTAEEVLVALKEVTNQLPECPWCRLIPPFHGANCKTNVSLEL